MARSSTPTSSRPVPGHDPRARRAPRGRRSARGRSCRTASRCSRVTNDGFSTVTTVSASQSRAQPADEVVAGRARGPSRCWRRPGGDGRAPRRTARAVSRPKNAVSVGTPRDARDVGDVAGGLDAEHGHAERAELAQQVAVVAGHLDTRPPAAEAELVGPCASAYALGVREPRGAHRGQVRVVAEDPLGPDELADLAEAAGRADPQVQREDRVRGVGGAAAARWRAAARRGRGRTRAGALSQPRQVCTPRGVSSVWRCSGSVTGILRRSRSRSRAGRATSAAGDWPGALAGEPVQRHGHGGLPVQHADPAELLGGQRGVAASARRSRRSRGRRTRSRRGRAGPRSAGATPPAACADQLGDADGLLLGRAEVQCRRRPGVRRPAPRRTAGSRAAAPGRAATAAPPAGRRSGDRAPADQARTRSGSSRSPAQSPPPMTLPARAVATGAAVAASRRRRSRPPPCSRSTAPGRRAGAPRRAAPAAPGRTPCRS